ncbi:Rho guanine nucleotide exchange factor, putative [Entamoeba invadens IP1]|uniref:Rho guanine nucleotide exchange factor, putative n=1 Tax=Entamoeba invadens IP1 TaxID=370355 RepID=UPI0002C3F66D|nr:Rho guanine nucleotide exchange factor, putative [Entamoeba invadens IP1]ELP85326.1 Rho guanine nucleotide exchange factor, putative [Entamoeba invadens IP1]|eukprot:XP_004184672.1 Rho guanine nucleotide exchange factor, putative [Entamoeba invadens IP1]
METIVPQQNDKKKFQIGARRSFASSETHPPPLVENHIQSKSHLNLVENNKPINLNKETPPQTVEQKPKRDRIVEEIYSTELSYVTSLGVCESCYRSPMMKDNSPFKHEDVNEIFKFFDEVLKCNREFLSMLVQARKNDTLKNSISKIFLRFCPFFAIYQHFLINHDNAFSILTKLEDNSKLSAFLQTCQESITVPQKLDLRDYLIMPVQRLPRYNLLLTDLLKNTPQDHVEFQDLTKAVESVREVASKVNSSISATWRQKRVVELTKKLYKLDNFELVEPHRTFVLEACVQQGTHTGFQKRVLLVFNDVILLTKKEEKLRIHHVIKISHLKVAESEREDVLVFYSDEKSCEILFDTQSEAEELKKEVTEIQSKFKNESVAFAELVIPPEDVTLCAGCSCVFGKRKRKNFCKKCKSYVCQKCWNNSQKCCDMCEIRKDSEQKIKSPRNSDKAKQKPLKVEQVAGIINLDVPEVSKVEEKVLPIVTPIVDKVEVKNVVDVQLSEVVLPKENTIEEVIPKEVPSKVTEIEKEEPKEQEYSEVSDEEPKVPVDIKAKQEEIRPKFIRRCEMKEEIKKIDEKKFDETIIPEGPGRVKFLLKLNEMRIQKEKESFERDVVKKPVRKFVAKKN